MVPLKPADMPLHAAFCKMLTALMQVVRQMILQRAATNSRIFYLEGAHAALEVLGRLVEGDGDEV